MSRDTRQATRLARLAARLAKRAAKYDHKVEDRAYAIALRTAEARLLEPLSAGGKAAAVEWPRRRALLIINTKSGPRHDSILRVREIVDLLGRFNIQADVRVKLRKAQAKREARAAVKAGYPLVIAAGGDGTIEAVASGLIDTRTVLGILPLGTYNNVATCLGIPTDLTAACALIASSSPRAIDAGQVAVRGKKPRFFLETCAVGLGAALTTVGQDAEKARWGSATRALPVVVGMPPTTTQIRLDRGPPRWAYTLLVTVSNAPRAGAALQVAPGAKMDDALLDVCIYDGLQQADLAARFTSLKNGGIVDDPRVKHARAVSVKVRSATPLPVTADSKLIGVTPARFSLHAGGLLVVVGPGAALALPAPSMVTELIAEVAPAVTNMAQAALPTPALPTPVQRRTATALAGARVLAPPLVAALLIKALPPIARSVARRLERR